MPAKLRSVLLVLLAAAALPGCAMTPTPEQMQASERYRTSIPTCSAAKECEVKWAAARNWMLGNCGFRLEKIEPDYLETYKSGDSASTDLYCRVTRTPISDTAYRIELTAAANNFLMYSAAQITAIHQRFNDAVEDSWHAAP